MLTNAKQTTDGPNGARGESYVSGIRAACFPCGTSLGATFDRDLLYRVGKEIALEAKSKSAHVLLAPTLNMIRSPRGMCPITRMECARGTELTDIRGEKL